MNWLDPNIAALFLISAGLLLAVFHHDVLFRRIPNVLVGSILVCGLTVQMLTQPTLQTALTVAVSGIAIVGFIPIIFYACGRLGGGDVKLMCSLGSFLSPVQSIELLLFSSVGFGLVALTQIFLSRLAGPPGADTAKSSGRYLRGLTKPGVPGAPAIGIAWLIVMLNVQLTMA